MTNKFKVTCFQTNSSDIPEENIKMLEKIFMKMNSGSSDLICMPECVSVFTDSTVKINDYIDNWHKIFLDFITSKARSLRSNILIGSFPFRNNNNNKFLNRSLLINEDGKHLNFYDKINLFDVCLENGESYMESNNYDAGKKLQLAKLPWGKLGMSICYDLRFPFLYKKLAKKGADFFSIPAAFTYTTGRSHWHSLIRARAIENGCFVFAAAQCGYHKNGRRTFGHSLIVDPWGKILAEAQNKICSITASIDTSLVTRTRSQIPSTIDYTS